MEIYFCTRASRSSPPLGTDCSWLGLFPWAQRAGGWLPLLEDGMDGYKWGGVRWLVIMGIISISVPLCLLELLTAGSRPAREARARPLGAQDKL